MAKRPLPVDLGPLLKQDRARLLACLIRQFRDFELAEDCLQDAVESALVHWHRSGAAPGNPAGWLLQVARRKAIDRLRRENRFAARRLDLAVLLEQDQEAQAEDQQPIPDERLRLIFTCCHPALEPKSRVALTLTTLCGLKTDDVARAFVDNREAMAQRLVRSKRKIKTAGIAFDVPEPSQWAERLGAVLDVIYLIFNAGYSAQPHDDGKASALCNEAIRLARTLDALCREEAEIEGLLALLLLQNSRHSARFDHNGCLVSLEEQDRSLWNAQLIAEGTGLVEAAMRRRAIGPFQLQAAIAALHAHSPSHKATDWQQIALLYAELVSRFPNPVAVVNQAVAVSYAQDADAGLMLLETVSSGLETYQPYHAARADMLARSGKRDLAREAFARAIGLTSNMSEQTFLKKRVSFYAL